MQCSALALHRSVAPMGMAVSISAHWSLPCSAPQEITLWRKGDIVRRSMSQQATIASQRFESPSERVQEPAKEKEDSS